MSHKVCVITGSRAEYGLLSPLMRKLSATEGVTLQVIATGMHLEPRYGETWRQISSDGFKLDASPKALVMGADGADMPRSIALGITNIAKALSALGPDIVVVLGDRFEIFAAATAAVCLHIPIAHLHGGELTEGAIDDTFRHAITKMSHLHFTSTGQYRQRVIQLGEQPSSVFSVGALGIDNIRTMKLLDRAATLQRLGADGSYLLVTYHPVTNDTELGLAGFKAMLSALKPHGRLVFTMPNADTGGMGIARLIEEYVKRNPGQASVHTSMGQLLYLSAMKHASAVVGNSSSGIIEAPSLGIPTINIGDRQKGRTRAASVIDCAQRAGAIDKAITRALSASFMKKAKAADNPYGDGRTAPRIVAALKRKLNAGIAYPKKFYDIRRPD